MEYLNVKKNRDGIEFFRSEKRPDYHPAIKAVWDYSYSHANFGWNYGDTETGITNPSQDELIELLSLGMEPTVNRWVLSALPADMANQLAQYAERGIAAGSCSHHSGEIDCVLMPHDGKFYAIIEYSSDDHEYGQVSGIAPSWDWVADLSAKSEELRNADELSPDDGGWKSAAWAKSAVYNRVIEIRYIDDEE